MADERYEEAVTAFMTEPEALTLEQIETLQAADATLGARAIHKRRDASIRAAEARHRRAMGEPPKKRDRADAIADTVLDLVTVALVQSRQRLAALEQQQRELEARQQALTTELQQLDADRQQEQAAVRGLLGAESRHLQ